MSSLPMSVGRLLRVSLVAFGRALAESGVVMAGASRALPLADPGGHGCNQRAFTQCPQCGTAPAREFAADRPPSRRTQFTDDERLWENEFDELPR